MNWPSYIYIPLVCLLLFIGCRRNLYDVPLPSDITKKHRESIGNYINQSIFEDIDKYPLLEKSETNIPTFNLIQSLYDQVTNVMRQDNKSPDSNKWTRGRQWAIRIINIEEQKAFVVPGGDLYLSKGILKALKSESELYYLLALEATLMSDLYLLREMITAYSTRTLVAIAENQSSSDSRIEEIINEVPQLTYSNNAKELIGYQVSETICETSIYSPLIADKIENRLSKTDQWLSTRPIYQSTDQSINCGDIVTKGLYQTEVLDRL